MAAGRTPPTGVGSSSRPPRPRPPPAGGTASLVASPSPPGAATASTMPAAAAASGNDRPGAVRNRNRTVASSSASASSASPPPPLSHRRSPSTSIGTASSRSSSDANDGPIADPARVYSTTRRIRMLLRRGVSSARSLGSGGTGTGSGGGMSGRSGGSAEGSGCSSGGGGGSRRRGRPSSAPNVAAGRSSPSDGSPRSSHTNTSGSHHDNNGNNGAGGGMGGSGGGGGRIGATGSPYLHGMRDLPSARLGLRWSRSSLDGGNDNHNGDDDNDDNDDDYYDDNHNDDGHHHHYHDPHRHDPRRVNPLNRTQTALVEEDFVPSVPPCRTIDEALWALYELLSEGGRSPYDDDNIGNGGDNDNDNGGNGSNGNSGVSRMFMTESSAAAPTPALGDWMGGIIMAGGTEEEEEEYDWLLDGDSYFHDVVVGGAGGSANGDGEVGSGDRGGETMIAEEDGGGGAAFPPVPVPLEDCIAKELRLELERWYQPQDGSDGHYHHGSASLGDGTAADVVETESKSTKAASEGATSFDGFDRAALRRQLVDVDYDKDYGDVDGQNDVNGDVSIGSICDIADTNSKTAPEEANNKADTVPVADGEASVACENEIEQKVIVPASSSSSSSSSEASAEEESLESASDEESVAPPLLLDLTIGRYADFLRSLPLAEPTSDVARFTRRAQIRLLREIGRNGGAVAEGIVGEYDSDEDFCSHADNYDESSDNSSLRTEEGEDGDENKDDTEGGIESNSSGFLSEEDKWWRRTAAELEQTLSDEYFSNEADPVLSALLAVPWDERPPTDPAYVHGNRASFDKMEPYDEYFSRQLSELDQVQQRVTKRLVARVRQKKRALDRGMRRVQDLDLDIARANLEVEAGSNCLRRARQAASQADGLDGPGGVLGGLRIVDEADARDRLRSLRSVVEEVDNLLQTEATIMGLPVSVDEYLDRIGQANGLKESVYRLGGGQLGRLYCLAELQNRVDDVGNHLASQMAASLSLIIASRCDHKRLLLGGQQMDVISSYDHNGFISQYATLLRARLVLARQEGQANDNKLSMANWTDSLSDALCFEIDKCLAHALLDPTQTAQNSAKEECHSDFVQDLAHLRQQLSEIKGVNPNDKSKLRIIVHNLFTIRFDFESSSNHLPWIYHKFCSLVANIIQVYLEIHQWHSALGEDQSSGESSIQCSNSKELSLADVQRRMENDASDDDETDWGARLAQLLRGLQASKPVLWRYCQSTFVKMLDQFIIQSTKSKSIKGEGNDEAEGEGKWALQLEGLHDVWQLTKQINALGKQFAGDTGSDALHHSEWKDKLSQIFRSHLRRVHVESMNTMGAMLAHETWMLLPIPIDTPNTWQSLSKNLKNNHKPGNEAKDTLKNTLESLCPLHFVDSRVLAATGRRSWDNLLLDEREGLSQFNHGSTNPFVGRRCTDGLLSNERTQLHLNDSASPLPDHSKPPQLDVVDSLYQAISPFINQDPIGQRVLTAATQGSMNGLGKWMARLLNIMDKLPLIAADVTKVISNLVDMYVLTVLRLCCGNGPNEDTALGISRDVSEDDEVGDGNSPPKAGGHSRQSSSGSLGSPIPLTRTASHPGNPISNTIEAEMCAPQPRDKNRLSHLRDFVLRGHESLSGMVNLTKVEKWDAISSATTKGPVDPKREVKDAAYILERQVSAAISCLYVAALLDVAVDRLKCPRGEGVRASRYESISSFVSYTTSVIKVAPSLTTLATKMACMRAIKGKRIVLEVMMVGSAWKDRRFSEHSNDYVDAMCLRCARIWETLSSSPRKLPAHSLCQVWKHIVKCNFLSLLEGFSKVVICSMEGRALMSMDLATYYAGCNPDAVENRIQGIFRVSPEPPPSISAVEDMQYVDSYVKAFYFPEEDLISWIESSRGKYHLRHMIGLLSCAAAINGWQERRLQDLIKKVQEMYV